MAMRKPLVVAIKASVDGAIRSAKDLARSINGVAKSSEDAQQAQDKFGDASAKSTDEANAALKRLGVKRDELADKQIASQKKNKALLKELRREQKITADEYVRGMKSAETRISAIYKSIGRDSRTMLEKQRDDFKKIAGGLGRAGAGAAAGGTAAGTAAIALGGEISDRGTQIRRASIVSGESIEDIQALGYAFSSVGLGIEEAGDMLKDFNEKLGEGRQTGSGGIAGFIEEIAPRLGLASKQSVENADGIRRAVRQIFGDKEGIDALRTYVGLLDKANLSQADYTIYLEDMVSESTLLLPLLKGGGDELERLIETAKTSGNLFTDEDLENADRLREATAKLRLEFQGLGLDIFGGTFTDGVNWFTEQVNGFRVGLHEIGYQLGINEDRFHSSLYKRSGFTPEQVKAASAPVNITIDSQTFSDIGNNPDAAKALEARMNQKASVRPTSMPRTFR